VCGIAVRKGQAKIVGKVQASMLRIAERMLGRGFQCLEASGGEGPGYGGRGPSRRKQKPALPSK